MNQKQLAMTTVVVAETPPRFSEVWMRRMNRMLKPEVEAAYLHGFLHPNELEEDDFRQAIVSPPWALRMPRRVALKFAKNAIHRNLIRKVQQVRERGEKVQVLCHYLTNAVYLKPVWDQVNAELYVHCHGHDVTWGRRVEFMPWMAAHPRGYINRVRPLVDQAIFIANSKATCAKLRQIGIPEKRIELKYLGVEVDHAPPSRINVSSELNILFLGRLTDFKGPAETILAFDAACANGLNARLRLAGGGHQSKACEQAKRNARFASRIDLLGPVSADQAKQLLREADIFTAHNQTSPVTGQEEAFGVSVIEAMAAAIPVVTGRSGGVCETVVDGKTGILFDPGSITQHADALCQLANDPATRHAMGMAGFRRVRDEFSLMREQNRLQQILGR